MATTGLLGRELELQALTAFLDDLGSGPAALLLEGEAGIGKTSVWKEGLAAAEESGIRVLSARPTQSETSLAFAALGDLLGEVLEATLPTLPSPQRRALEIALLRVEMEGTPVDRRAVSLAVLGVLRSLAAGGPMVLAIDDIQVLDPETARVLSYAIRRLDHEPVGILATLRLSAGDGMLLDIDQSLPEDRIRRVRLGPLTGERVDRLLASRLGTRFLPSTSAQLHRTSGGNPLFALEIARALIRRGLQPFPDEVLPVPNSLRDLMRDRVGSLSARVSRALLVTSALSQPTVELVGAAIGSLLQASASLAEAVEGGVLEIDADRIRFSHPLLRSVVYADAPLERRRQIHRRLADVVTDPEERARHLALATEGPNEDVAEALDEAARRARGRGAPDAAAELAELARRLTPAGTDRDAMRRVVQAAQYRFEAGSTARARVLLEEARSAMPSGPDRAEALRLLGAIRWYDSRQEAMGLFDDALREAGDDPSLRAGIERDVAWTVMLSGDAITAEVHARAALQLAERLADPSLLAEALTAVGFIDAVRGRSGTFDVLERAVGLEQRTGALRLFRHPRLMYGIALKWADRFEDARAMFEVVRHQAVERGDESTLPFTLYHLSELECWAGEWEVAARLADESLELAMRTAQEPFRAASLYAQALVSARRGRVEEARRMAEEGVAVAERTGTTIRVMQNLQVLGFLALSEGDAAAAVGFLRRVEELTVAMGIGEPGSIRFHGDHIEALVALGDLEPAKVALDALDERATALGRPWSRVIVARCRGLVAAEEQRLDEALEWLQRAGQEHAHLADPFELGRSLLAVGKIQRRIKQKALARASLQRGLEIFDQLGAALWSERVRSELARIGGRAPAPLDLTPTERRVAELVADGRTNREVADALFMALRTVEDNLTKIYRKLNIRSRSELTRWLMEEGPAGHE